MLLLAGKPALGFIGPRLSVHPFGVQVSALDQQTGAIRQAKRERMLLLRATVTFTNYYSGHELET
jgi:hypothetical protein